MALARCLVRLGNKEGYRNKDWPKIAELVQKALSCSPARIGNLRISSSAIEFDLLVDKAEDADPLIPRLSSIGETLTVRRLDVEMPKLDESGWIREGVRLFNEERFWECHEALEQVWRSRTGYGRELLQGIILVAAALVHYQRDEPEVCISILRRAQAKLKDAEGIHFDIDLDGLKSKLAEIVETGNIRVFRL